MEMRVVYKPALEFAVSQSNLQDKERFFQGHIFGLFKGMFWFQGEVAK